MKICFLDIDGVLNSAQTHGRLHTRYYELLRRLVDATDCHFVITSSWRCMNLEDTKYELSGHIDAANKKNRNRPSMLQDPFPEWLLDRIVGVTPRAYYFVNYDTHRHFLCPRGVEIEHFMRETDIIMDAYVIIDDDTDFLSHQVEHFVHVDPTVGLTPDDVARCVDILNGDF